jgi:hypothetical protein
MKAATQAAGKAPERGSHNVYYRQAYFRENPARFLDEAAAAAKDAPEYAARVAFVRIGAEAGRVHHEILEAAKKKVPDLRERQRAAANFFRQTFLDNPLCFLPSSYCGRHLGDDPLDFKKKK